MSMNSESLGSRFAEWVRATPAEDLRRNAHAWFSARLAELELVPRSEFDQQVRLLERCEARLAELEAKVAALEKPAESRHA
jgi:BMFP domain-containing protein YqiC